MNLTPQDLASVVATTGFGTEPLEKVLRLMSLLGALTKKLEMECRERLALVLPLSEHELEFLRRLNDEGVIVPELLTADSGIQATLHTHPGLKWKVQNVRKHRSLDRSDGSDLP